MLYYLHKRQLIFNVRKFFQRSRFARTTAIGVLATVADMGVLMALVHPQITSPQQANLPSLLAGSAIQFLGNRYWVFHAEERPLGRQLFFFLIVEAIAFGLSLIGFDLILKYTSVYYPLARPLSVSFVFFGFSYPAWKIIFRTSATAPTPEAPAESPLHKSVPSPQSHTTPLEDSAG